jgi:Icc protein
MRRSVFLATVAISLLSAGCIKTTPFDTDVEQRDLNDKNLARLLETQAPRPFKFVVIGDTHDEYDDTARAVRIINARNDISFVAHTGDITDRGLLKEFEWTQAVFDDLEIPLLMSLGNHDAISDGKEIYRRMYGDYDYSFIYGNVKFIFFNSNELEFPGQAPNKEWLTAEVSDLRGAGGAVLVAHQGPPNPANAGAADSAAFYQDLLRGHDIILFAHGHLHDFRLSRYEETPVLQAGTFQEVRTYSVVTIGPDLAASYQLCRFESCEPVIVDDSVAPTR